MNGDIDSVNHVGVAVRDMAKGTARYEALGFTLTPLSVHSGSSKPGEPVQPMATGNRCAVFPNNYVEVLGIVNPGRPAWGWDKFVSRFQGAHIICFGCKDAGVVDKRVSGNAIKTSGVIALQRDVETPEGMRTARFDCVHFEAAAMPEGLIQAARHRNPEYIHQPRYLSHANGAAALSEVVLVADDPAALAAKYERLTGQKAKADGRRRTIDLPLVSRLTFIGVDEVASVMPGSLMAPPPCIAAMGFTVKDLGQTAGVLDKSGITYVRDGKRLVVPAEEGMGVAHIFAAT
jgi:hypothetical protein